MTPAFIIAEAGVNHNGSLAMAKELIEVAARARADAVKFQTFKARNVISRFAPKAEYQLNTTPRTESQLDMARKLELDEAAHRELQAHCAKLGIEFMSTPFDLESVDLLVRKLDVRRLKLSSGEVTNPLLLLKAARGGKPIIISTGMCTLADVQEALGVLAFGYTHGKGRESVEAFKEAFASEGGQKALKENVTLLHCNSEYPTPFRDVNLHAMKTLKEAFGLPVGFSDHTPGITVPIAAVALGAVMIEKHFTLDKSLPGPDHQASVDPSELAALVRSVREAEQAAGSGLKTPTASESKNMKIHRRSLVALRPIRKGEILSEENLTAKRPGDGISPYRFWEFLGRPAARDYQEDEKID